MKNSYKLLIALGGILSLSACSTNMQTPSQEKLSTVQTGAVLTAQESNSATQMEEESSAADANPKISDGCLAAWRQAIAGDEKGAMNKLTALDAEFPRSTSVQLMMGQVCNHFGKKKEAVAHYHLTVSRSLSNPVFIYKLAESMRTSGDAAGSIVQFRKALSISPDFAPAKIGLAKALLKLDKNSVEARTQIKEVLAQDPNDKDAKSLAEQTGLAK
jgi:predicted Zn-dependent protease